MAATIPLTCFIADRMVDGEVHFKVVMCKVLFGLHHIEEWKRFADPTLDHCKLFPQAVKGMKLEYLEVRIAF